MPSPSSIRMFRGGLFAAVLASSAFVVGCTAASAPSPAETEDPGGSEDAVTGTVATALANSCSTSSVSGLSKQIIAEARCMDASTYAAVPDLGNVSFGGSVYAYMEGPARDKLVAALKAHTSKSMSVNSMLRTIAQQYLLYSWYKTGRCGIGLAATPGNSNHETGLAVDVSEYSSWKGTLQAYGFHWLGSSDPVHFDYAGAGAKSYKGVDVKAFQRLWNRNHPSDTIDTDGAWGPQTEARMKKAPAGGFAKGATCGSSQSFDSDAELVAGNDDTDLDMPVTAVEADHAEHVMADAHGEMGAAATQVSAESDSCSSCFDTICANDAHCCDTEWDDQCVTEGLQICESLCGASAMQPL